MMYDLIEVTPKKNWKKILMIVLVIVLVLMLLFALFFMKNKNVFMGITEENITNTIAEKQDIIVDESKQKTKHIAYVSMVPNYTDTGKNLMNNIYSSDEKVAYLTFDDGPSATITPQILDILKNENVPATFFVVGSRVNMYPNLVKRAYEEGHYIANHGYSHSYSNIYRSVDTIFGEYVDCENAVRAALGIEDYRMYLFRYPGGSSGGKYSDVKAESKSVLNSYGVSHTNWNCMTGDAEGKNTVEDQLNELKLTMEGDDTIVVLMHDASDKQVTVEALPEVIRYLREQGYVFKNFYEIF